MEKQYLCKLAFMSSIIIILSSYTDFKTTSFTNYQTLISSDSTAFSTNTVGGWSKYSSYLDKIGDSVDFEIILVHSASNNIIWNQVNEIGSIKNGNGYRPSSQRIVRYSELPRIWDIIFQTDGKVYIKLSEGPFPSTDPIVIPIITKFRK